MTTIERVDAREILDSRGFPTVRGDGGSPAGAPASRRFPPAPRRARTKRSSCATATRRASAAKGVRRAVGHVRDVIAPALRGVDASDQAPSTRSMIALDGTPNKGRLGANAILAVSLACARRRGRRVAAALPRARRRRRDAPARADDERHQRRQARRQPLDFQEFMIVPHGAPSFPEALRQGVEVYHALRRLLEQRALHRRRRRGRLRARAARATRRRSTCSMEAIATAGLTPGRDVSLALDAAASELADGDGYVFRKAGGPPPLGRRADRALRALVRALSIVSIEDGLGERDWAGWKALTAALGSARPARRRRPLLSPTSRSSPGHRGRARQRDPRQGEPDRHAHRDAGGDGARRRARAIAASSRIARARPRMRSSPTSRWRPARDRSRPARPAARSARRSTTGCSSSPRSWVRPRATSRRSAG